MGRPIIFYTPHQDDETLFAGQILAHHAMVGRRVIIVSATDGSTTAMIHTLNGKRSNGWWQGFHYPAREGYGPLTPSDIARARDLELIAAGGLLGAWPNDIHLRPGVREPEITLAQAESMIRHYAALYPDAGHYTTWWGDRDRNHATLGQALRNLPLKDRRWVARAEYGVGVPYRAPEGAKLMARRATSAYRSWAPEQGLFAIGYHSVAPYFAEVEQGRPNYIVGRP